MRGTALILALVWLAGCASDPHPSGSWLNIKTSKLAYSAADAEAVYWVKSKGTKDIIQMSAAATTPVPKVDNFVIDDPPAFVVWRGPDGKTVQTGIIDHEGRSAGVLPLAGKQPGTWSVTLLSARGKKLDYTEFIVAPR